MAKLALQNHAFSFEYRRAIKEILQFWSPELQQELSLNCSAWAPNRFNFRTYLECSEKRYLMALSMLGGVEHLGKFCDVGGFFGAFPLALGRLGVDVCMTETLSYYSNSFCHLFEYLVDQGIKIIDWDPFSTSISTQTGTYNFDTVTLMAVLEHYPHSPKNLMRHVSELLVNRGTLLIEVPNLASWPRRAALLRGKSPLPDIATKWTSAIPFIGHHHEYTLSHLQQLISLSGLTIRELRCFDYSLVAPFFNRLLTNPLQTAISAAIPSARECLIATCSKPNHIG